MKKLILENFQGHSYLEVPLDQITTIVGSSDIGKSSIFRALRWVCLNKSPSRLIKDGAKVARVTLELEDCKVVREESSSFRRYILNYDRADGLRESKTFEAFRSEVPDEIRKFLEVTEINFQRQFAPPFWFEESPGEVSRQLNQIVDLNIIDVTLSKVGSSVREAKTSEEVARQKYEQSEKSKEELRYVVEMKAEAEVLSTLHLKMQESALSRTTLQSYLESATTHKRRKDNAISAYDALVVLLEKRQKVQDLEVKVVRLRQHLKVIVYSNQIAKKPIPDIDSLIQKEYHSAATLRELSEFKKVFDQAKIWSFAYKTKRREIKLLEERMRDIGSLLDKRRTWDTYFKKIEGYRETLKRIKLSKENLEIKQEFLNHAEKEFKESFPEVCPLCGKK